MDFHGFSGDNRPRRPIRLRRQRVPGASAWSPVEAQTTASTCPSAPAQATHITMTLSDSTDVNMAFSGSRDLSADHGQPRSLVAARPTDISTASGGSTDRRPGLQGNINIPALPSCSGTTDPNTALGGRQHGFREQESGCFKETEVFIYLSL